MSTSTLDKPAAHKLQLVSTAPKTITAKQLIKNVGDAERHISLAASRIFHTYHKEVTQPEPGFLAERLQTLFGADMALLQANLTTLINNLKVVHQTSATDATAKAGAL